MLYWSAKITKFLCFVAMLIFGVLSVPRMLFLLFLPLSGGSMPAHVVRDVLVSFALFVVATVGYIGIASWLRRQEEFFG